MDEFDTVLGSRRGWPRDESDRWWLAGRADPDLAAFVEWLETACETGYDLLYLEEDPRRVMPEDPAGIFLLARSFAFADEEPLRRVASAEERAFVVAQWPRELKTFPQRQVTIGPLYVSAPSVKLPKFRLDKR